MVEKKPRVEAALRRFQEACRGTGVKVTHQRLVILNSVVGSEDHPDAESVYESVRKEMPTISLDTVYRTLWLFKDMGILSTVGPPRDRIRFDPNTMKHHHFICERCGAAYDFNNPEFDKLLLPSEVRSLGTVETTHVELRGLCRDCMSSEGKNAEDITKGETS